MTHTPVLALVQQLICCVTLDKPLHPTGPDFLHLTARVVAQGTVKVPSSPEPLLSRLQHKMSIAAQIKRPSPDRQLGQINNSLRASLQSSENAAVSPPGPMALDLY